MGHDPASPEETHGPEGIKRYVATMRAAFPDLRVTVEDRVAEGEEVATRYTTSGTHEDDLMGIAPTDAAYVGYTLAIHGGASLVSFVLGALVFRRKSDDWYGLFVSLFLITFGTSGVSAVSPTPSPGPIPR